MRICNTRRKIQRVLQIQKGILRTRRYGDDIPGKDLPDIRVLYTGMVGRHTSSNPGRQKRTREKTLRCPKQAGESRTPSE